MKKRLAVLTVAIFVALSLAISGCAGKSGGGSTEAGNEKDGAIKKGSSVKKDLALGDLISKGQKIDGMYYEYVVDAVGQKMEGKVWMTGKKMRTEGTFLGQKSTVIVDGEKNVAYMIDEENKKAMKIPMGETSSLPDKPTDYLENIDIKTAKSLETTTYNGIKCRVISIQVSNDETGKINTKMWITEDNGLPVRIEASLPDGSKMAIDYKNLKVGKQPAEMFEIPAGMEVTDLSEFQKQLPNLPKQ
ncbi:MAG: DUF4412 domain-containing protein [Firmicutes bacterium]|nr:DUF4412 domain-containing protein [Bacillota bacterium]